MRLPPEEDIRAKATELGLIGADGALSSANRARAVKALTEHPAAKAPTGTVLSRSVVRVSDGHLVVEVTHVPDPPATS